MIITFLWTSPALIAGAKTVTRRDWQDNYRLRFRKGMIVEAYDKRKEWGGSHIANIRLTETPYQEYSCDMPEEDFEGEGFAWLRDHPEALPKKWKGVDLWRYFHQWKHDGSMVTVVRFELVEVFAKEIESKQLGLTL